MPVSGTLSIYFEDDTMQYINSGYSVIVLWDSVLHFFHKIKKRGSKRKWKIPVEKEKIYIYANEIFIKQKIHKQRVYW